MDTETLEAKAEACAREAVIPEEPWEKFKAHMQKLASHNVKTYCHSLRVGIYAFGLAKEENFPDPALAFLGGLGHDIGKCKIGNEILNKAGLLSDEEFEIVKKHPEYGFEELKDDFPLPALVAGAHHCFQSEPYGMRIDDFPGALPAEWELSAETLEKLENTVRLVRLADFFDGRTTRSDKEESGGAYDPAHFELQHIHLKDYTPYYETRLAWLIENKIQ